MSERVGGAAGAEPPGSIPGSERCERARASEPARTERGVGVPASERVGGAAGAEPPGSIFDLDHETFRNELASVYRDGRRKWVYARQPSGRRYRARTVASWFLLAFLFLAPFVKVGGEPLILLNVLERRFVLFGLVFWPQDFYLVVLIALAVLVTIVLSSATVGRVWCGWLCPQTVFMEMLFRKIEYAIDGSAAQQLRLAKAPLGLDKLWRRALKHGVFFGLSFVIANVFLAYIIGAEALWAIVTTPPSEHLVGLVTISLFSLVFYGVFARFREQACTLACPYGRLMSAFIDSHTVTVTYDWRRGEPRGKLIHARASDRVGAIAPFDEASGRPEPSRGSFACAPRPTGDCVDCGQCVTVCPTGIDIRNGIQLECISCTACMDACDDVMARLRRPAGLIRLTSNEAIRAGRASWLTARVKAYAAVWAVLVTTVVSLLIFRSDLDVLILRQPGTLYATAGGGAVANFYNVQVINRTNRPRALEYRVLSPEGASITPLGAIGEAAPHGLVESRFLVNVPPDRLTGPTTAVQFEVRSEGRVVEVIESSFLGPGRN